MVIQFPFLCPLGVAVKLKFNNITSDLLIITKLHQKKLRKINLGINCIQVLLFGITGHCKDWFISFNTLHVMSSQGFSRVIPFHFELQRRLLWSQNWRKTLKISKGINCLKSSLNSKVHLRVSLTGLWFLSPYLCKRFEYEEFGFHFK